MYECVQMHMLAMRLVFKIENENLIKIKPNYDFY